MKRLFIIIPVLFSFMVFGCISKEKPIEEEKPKIEEKKDKKEDKKENGEKQQQGNPPPPPPPPPKVTATEEVEPLKADIDLNLFVDKFPSKVAKIRFKADLELNPDIKPPYTLTMLIKDKKVALAPVESEDSEKKFLSGTIDFEYSEDQKPFLSELQISSVNLKSDSSEVSINLENDFVITEENVAVKLTSPAALTLSDIAGIKSGELKYTIAFKGMPFVSDGKIEDFNGSFAEIPIASPTANNEDIAKMLEDAAEKLARLVLTTVEKKDRWEMRTNLFVTPYIHTSCAAEVPLE